MAIGSDDLIAIGNGHLHAGHHGLLGMRYRIESLGGTLQLLSAPGRGTVLRVSLPLAEKEAA